MDSFFFEKKREQKIHLQLYFGFGQAIGNALSLLHPGNEII
jgi:hypothetical protein